jgi:hypothetical protein
MYTTFLLVALTGLPAANADEAPAWLTDYGSARKQGMEEKKPLAIFLAPGKDGWNKVARDGKLGKEADQLLADNYVCLHVNTSTEAGKKLAALLEVESGKGLVVTDRAVNLMAFHHDGDLATTSLTRYLKRYADPNHVVKTTETNPTTTQQSYYPPAAPPAQPTYYPGSFGGFTGGRGGC